MYYMSMGADNDIVIISCSGGVNSVCVQCFFVCFCWLDAHGGTLL